MRLGCLHPHFIGEETEALRGEATSPISQLGLDLGQPAYLAVPSQCHHLAPPGSDPGPRPQHVTGDIPTPAPRPGHAPVPAQRWGRQKGYEQLCSRPGLGRGSGAPSSLLGPHVLLSAWHLMGIEYIFAE